MTRLASLWPSPPDESPQAAALRRARIEADLRLWAAARDRARRDAVVRFVLAATLLMIGVAAIVILHSPARSLSPARLGSPERLCPAAGRVAPCTSIRGDVPTAVSR